MTKQRAKADSWPTKPMPSEAHKVLELDGMFSKQEFNTIQLGLIPQKPTDAWFIYFDDEWLHIHRSKTGTCVFKLQIVPFEDRYHAPQAIVNRDPKQYRNEDVAYDVQMISYLIDHLLLGRFAQLPTPKGLRKQDQARYKRDVMGKQKESGRIDLGKLNGRNRPQN